MGPINTIVISTSSVLLVVLSSVVALVLVTILKRSITNYKTKRTFAEYVERRLRYDAKSNRVSKSKRDAKKRP